jgi:hypothetical protein
MDPTHEALIWRLYLVREILLDALDLASDALPVGRMRAVLSLDQASELLLSVVLPLPGLDVTPQRDWPLQKMLDELCQRKPALQPYRAGIGRLRRVRDRVQHDGVVPSAEDIRQMRLQTDAFIRDVVREVLQKELEELSPVEFISYDEARHHLLEAERALRMDDYETAVTEAAIGFSIGRQQFHAETLSYESWSRRLIDRLLNDLGEAATKAARRVRSTELKEFASGFDSNVHSFGLASAFQELVEPLEIARYGLDAHRYARFKEVTPYVYWTLGGDNPKVSVPDEWNPSQEDALVALDFATVSLIQLGRWKTKTRSPFAVKPASRRQPE